MKGTVFRFKTKRVAPKKTASGKKLFSKNHLSQLKIMGELKNKKHALKNAGGAFFIGKAKFSDGRVERAVVKILPEDVSKSNLNRIKEVIKRLQSSKVKHPLVEFLESEHNGKKVRMIVTEAFYKSSKAGAQTKFTHNISFMSRLDINHNSADRKIFRQAAIQTAQLAKAGIEIKVGELNGSPATGIFEYVNSYGGPVVYIQGTEYLVPRDSPKKSWEKSSKELLHLVTKKNPSQTKRAEEIIGKIGEMYSLSPKKLRVNQSFGER